MLQGAILPPEMNKKIWKELETHSLVRYTCTLVSALLAGSLLAHWSLKVKATSAEQSPTGPETRRELGVEGSQRVWFHLHAWVFCGTSPICSGEEAKKKTLVAAESASLGMENNLLVSK